MWDSKLQTKTIWFLGLLLWVTGVLLDLWYLSSGAIFLVILAALIAMNEKIRDLNNKFSFLQAK